MSSTEPQLAGWVRNRWPWWTEADQAEFDVLVHAFVDVAWVHREKCAICGEGGRWCKALREAFDVVLEWRECQHLRSKATWLRLREETKGVETGRVHVRFDEHGEIVEYEISPAGAGAIAAA